MRLQLLAKRQRVRHSADVHVPLLQFFSREMGQRLERVHNKKNGAHININIVSFVHLCHVEEQRRRIQLINIDHVINTSLRHF